MRERIGILPAGVALALAAAVSFAAPGAPSVAQRSASPRPEAGGAPPTVRQAEPRKPSAGRTPAPRRRAAAAERSHRRGRGWTYRLGWRGGYRLGVPFYGWSAHGFYPYFGYGWGYAPRVRGTVVGSVAAVGGLDLNVRPKKTQVYVDGALVGKTGQFDGFPSYLWLDSGVHELVFYREGYRTVARRVTVPRGGVVDVDLRLEAGEAVPPEALMAERPAPRRSPAPADRGRAPAAAESLDLRGEPGRFQISVEPRDASVYLDGRFVGTGGELSRLHGALIVEPGEHLLEVVRPGYRDHSETVAVEAGADVELRVELESELEG